MSKIWMHRESPGSYYGDYLVYISKRRGGDSLPHSAHATCRKAVKEIPVPTDEKDEDGVETVKLTKVVVWNFHLVVEDSQPMLLVEKEFSGYKDALGYLTKIKEGTFSHTKKNGWAWKDGVKLPEESVESEKEKILEGAE